MRPLKGKGPFDLVSAHNWIQHAKRPEQVLKNLDAVLLPGGKLYISTYHAGTFRFFITQIARALLDRRDYDLARSMAPAHFPTGFAAFANPVDIYMENIFDDFFVLYCHTTTHAILDGGLARAGYVATQKPLSDDLLPAVDNVPLRQGFNKTEKAGLDPAVDLWPAIDEFSGDLPACVKVSARQARQVLKVLRRRNDAVERVAFCLGLYRLRAELSLVKDVQVRHERLQRYLFMILEKSPSAISIFKDRELLSCYNKPVKRA